MQHKVTAQIGSTQINIETGKIAKLADGSVIVSCAETIVMVSAVSATALKEGQDWFPLTVDYREKAAAVGKFPGGYFKREGRPSEKETLTSRMTDRPLRPLFPQGYFYDTQIISILLSADGENDVLMIEGAAKELPEAEFIKALDFAHTHAREMFRIQKDLAAQVGKQKREMPLLNVNQDILEIAYRVAGDRIESALYTAGKVARSKAVSDLKEEVKAAVLE